jgi:hypothetical protein
MRRIFPIILAAAVSLAVAYDLPVGEKLTFVISWSNVMDAGTATMSIPSVVTFNKQKCYRLVTEAQSSPSFSSFFSVRDRVESLSSTVDHASWKYEKHLAEKDYRNNEVVYFNPTNRTVTAGTTSSRDLPNSMDVLAAFYWVRTQNLVVGQPLTFNYADGKTTKAITVNVLKKESVTVPAGTYDCIVVEPILNETEGIFRQQGRIWIYMTDDSKHMPVKMTSKIVIGDVEAKLSAVE